MEKYICIRSGTTSCTAPLAKIKKVSCSPRALFHFGLRAVFAYSSMEGQLHLIMPPEVAGFTEWFNSLTWLMNEANVNGFISNGLCVSADKAESSG